ncbi:hypothetical protein GFK26_17130 [Variovorax paradoxus]|uniref:Cobalt-zinc-cadmium resistance protein n=1 Tax=Variovorax paradoxus TaxID=34073 RepID=A0A5Q0M416_VARPD|nr:hypothetical protein [Variovorax paradoxus]QFZ84361.1 hypothetical protein GFK26_17130 [Variovorax paradoxus]
MRRWLLIFLLFLLPFQYSWAASAAYCLHEGDTGKGHWGHHESEPHGTDRTHAGDGAKKDSTRQPNAAVGHCIVAHFGQAQHADTAAALPADAPVASQVLRAVSTERFTSHIAEVPVRPDGSLAA